MKVRLVPALALVLLAGCSKLHVEKQYPRSTGSHTVGCTDHRTQ